MLKILQVRLQQYMNCELPDVQTGFRKGRGTRDQIASICWIIKKAREFQGKKKEYYLAIKKSDIMPATWMDVEIIILSQKEKDKYHVVSFTNGIWNTKQMKHIWNKNRPTDIENRLVVAKVGRVEGKTGSLELADANYSI